MEIIKEKGKGYYQLQTALRNLKGKVGKVGWFKENKYPVKDGGQQVAQVAAIQNNGSPTNNIPARPFMRPTILKKQHEWARIAEKSSMQVVNGKKTIGDVMNLIGLKAAGDIRETISLIYYPPLSPLTIKRRFEKRSNKSVIGNLYKPLVDTRTMIKTLHNVVEDEVGSDDSGK